MKRIQYLAVAFVAVAILSGDALAQQPANNTQFGRGRLLRKWRSQLSQQQQKQKRPTLEKQGKQPTLAKRPDSNSKSNTAYQRTGNQKNNRNSTNRSSSNRQQQARKAKKRGFGMEVTTDKNDNLVVTQVDANGNAATSGIRRGDYITQLGGVDLGSMEEFQQIAKVLGEGDEMDLQITRRGQKKDVKVQFGEIPEFKETAEQTAGDAKIVGPTSVSNPVAGNYDFAQQNNNKFQSVLDSQAGNRPSQRTPARPASSRTRRNGSKR